MIAIGLGSNLGNRVGHLKTALRQIAGLGYLSSLKVSPIYESQALLPPQAPQEWNQPFLNCIAVGESNLAPQDFLNKVKTLEKKQGRSSLEKWAPRPLDIDILFWNDIKINEPELKIPHPSLQERPFVLLPLSDLVSDFKSQVQKWGYLKPLDTQRYTTPVVKLFGIINVTPDSFSDGGENISVPLVLKNIQKLLSDGCSVIDIGAESTRPGATLLKAEEEWERLHPILKAISATFKNLELSLDTRHPEVAQRALAFGAQYINDVSAFTHTPSLGYLKTALCDLIFMHHLDIPPTPQNTLNEGEDPVQAILNWARHRIQFFEENGINRDRLIFDPGIGFGKTHPQCFEIVRRLEEFRSLGVRILVGHSRKSFLRLLRQNSEAQDRDLETALVTSDLAQNGADFLRVHNGKMNFQSLCYSARAHGVYP